MSHDKVKPLIDAVAALLRDPHERVSGMLIALCKLLLEPTGYLVRSRLRALLKRSRAQGPTTVVVGSVVEMLIAQFREEGWQVFGDSNINTLCPHASSVSSVVEVTTTRANFAEDIEKDLWRSGYRCATLSESLAYVLRTAVLKPWPDALDSFWWGTDGNRYFVCFLGHSGANNNPTLSIGRSRDGESTDDGGPCFTGETRVLVVKVK